MFQPIFASSWCFFSRECWRKVMDAFSCNLRYFTNLYGRIMLGSDFPTPPPFSAVGGWKLCHRFSVDFCWRSVDLASQNIMTQKKSEKSRESLKKDSKFLCHVGIFSCLNINPTSFNLLASSLSKGSFLGFTSKFLTTICWPKWPPVTWKFSQLSSTQDSSSKRHLPILAHLNPQVYDACWSVVLPPRDSSFDQSPEADLVNIWHPQDTFLPLETFQSSLIFLSDQKTDLRDTRIDMEYHVSCQQTNKQTNKQTKQTNKQASKQTNKQTTSLSCLIEILRHHFSHLTGRHEKHTNPFWETPDTCEGGLIELLKIIGMPFTVGKGRQGNRCQIAHCHLIRRSVFDDFLRFFNVIHLVHPDTLEPTRKKKNIPLQEKRQTVS